MRLAQKDFKKMIAYSSVSHMGFVLLGMASLNTMGISGAVLQMFNHGTITAMLFLLVGVVYDRTHTRGLEDLADWPLRCRFIQDLQLLLSLPQSGCPD